MKRSKNSISLLILVLFTTVITAQIKKLNVAYKVNNAPLIVEGTITEQHSVKQEKSIFTYYKMVVETVFKGQFSSTEIEIKSEGGIVGDSMLKTFPSNNLKTGDYGVYFLKKDPTQSYYNVAFFAQSELALAKKLTNQQRTTIKNNITLLENISNQYNENTNQRNITSISPTTVNAGIGDTVTITGSGFGATGPTASMMVWTVFSDNPSTRISFSDAYHYISWSDTEIVFKVPSDAATGTIRVGDATTYFESADVLQVNYNVRDKSTYDTTAIYPLNLPVVQDQGITFVPNTNFTNADAINRTKEAMDQWTCLSNMNWVFDDASPTANLNDSSDGLSVIYYDTTLSSQTLGVTKTSFSACSASGRWYITDVDIAINSSTNYNYTTNATGTGQYDYYSVILHELGHARNLGHTANTADIMYPFIGIATDNRLLQTNDIDGGLWVQNDSNTNQVCSAALMTNGTCANLKTATFNNKALTLYPNPALNIITLNTTENAAYIIYNIDGKQLKKGKLTEVNNTILVSNFSNGLFFIKVVFENGSVINSKFIKNK